MIKTPTYHVFNMYKHHQDADLVESYVETEKIGLEDENMVPNLTESVSIGKDGKLHITITNLSVESSYSISALLADSAAKSVTAEIVGGDIKAHNTFDAPENVTAKAYEAVAIKNGAIEFEIPASSVMHLTVEI